MQVEEYAVQKVWARTRMLAQCVEFSGAQNPCVAAKSAEKLAINIGRCCLFSVICADF